MYRPKRASGLSAICLILALTEPAMAADCTMVFQDDFNGKSLDRDAWATRYIYNNGTLDHLNDEVQRYRDNDNHRVAGGILSLVAREVASAKFESGMIRSRRTFLYGYFEARVRFPKGRGIWPAFWLNSDKAPDGTLTWPPEIDILEYAVNGKDDTSSMVHAGTRNSPNAPPIEWAYSAPGFNRRTGSYTADKPLDQGWHVFGLDWHPNWVAGYLDGQLLYKHSYHWVTRKGITAPPAHILLNFAIGGQWAGRYGIDTQKFPQSFDIDYVRVYQGADEEKACDALPARSRRQQ